MTIFNTPGSIYLNMGSLDVTEEYDFTDLAATNQMTWNTEAQDSTDMRYINEKVYLDQLRKARDYKRAYKAAKSYSTELRYILKQAVKHDDPKFYISNELRKLEDE